MLTKVALFLTAQIKGSIPISNAKAVHGTFLSEIRKVDEAYATELHEQKEMKPFNLSLLEGENQDENDLLFDIGSKAMFTVGMTSQKLFEVMNESVKRLHENAETIEMNRVRFKVNQMGVISQERKEDFLSKQGLKKPQQKFTIHFQSPTCFKSNGRTVLFPDSEFLVKSLNKRFASVFEGLVELTDVDVEELMKCFYPCRYQLKTAMLTTGRSLQIGFVGECTYEVAKDISKVNLAHLDRLIRLSEYTGVGYKTTMGFGQVQVTY